VAARLFFILLGTEADDYGCFAWKPIRLKMRLFPADHIEVEPLLAELVSVNRLIHYTVGEKHFGAIRNFTLFQRPKKPASHHPRDKALSFPSGQSVSINDYIGLGKKSTELNGVVGFGSTEPAPPIEPQSTEQEPPPAAPVSEKVGTGSAEGRKEGDKKEGGKEYIPSSSIEALSPASGAGLPEGQCSKPEPYLELGTWVLDTAGMSSDPRRHPVGIVRQWLADFGDEAIRAGVRTVVERQGYQPPKALKYFEPAIAEAADEPSRERMAYAKTFTADFTEARWIEYLNRWARGEEWPVVIGPAPNQKGTLVWEYLLDRYREKHGSLEPGKVKPEALRWDQVGLRVLAMAGLVDKAISIAPVKAWIDAGISGEDVLAAVKAVVEAPGYRPPKSLREFEPAVMARQEEAA
jgi:hypothetical protein